MGRPIARVIEAKMQGQGVNGMRDDPTEGCDGQASGASARFRETASRGMDLAARVREVRWLQGAFRNEPFGGRFPRLKRIAYRVLASSFDRQFKLHEALIDLCEDFVDETWRHRVGQAHASGQVSSTAQDDVFPPHLPDIFAAPAHLSHAERLLLYSLVFALRPKVCLEIGTFRGGSSAAICAALDDVGIGKLVCIEPSPHIPESLWTRIRHRVEIVQAPSPVAQAEAAHLAGAPFDFAFIDGDHEAESVAADIRATLPHCAPDSCLLLHDCFMEGVRAGIDSALKEAEPDLVDCGILSVAGNATHEDGGRERTWGGLRLLRWSAQRR